MAAERSRPTDARFDAPCVASTAVPRSRRSKSMASLPAGGESMATSGEAASHGPVHAGPHGARLRVDREMRNSCKDPMERRSGRWGGMRWTFGGHGMGFSRKTTRGAVSTNRAATLCNCQGTGAGGWGARSCRWTPRGAFSTNRAATLCDCLAADAGGFMQGRVGCRPPTGGDARAQDAIGRTPTGYHDP